MYNDTRCKESTCGCSSSGRAPPCQGGGSEFEPRHPLQKKFRPSPKDGLNFFRRKNEARKEKLRSNRKHPVDVFGSLCACRRTGRCDKRASLVGTMSACYVPSELGTSAALIVPPLRKKSRSAHLFVCKRTHDGSLSLPTFCGYEEVGLSVRGESLLYQMN